MFSKHLKRLVVLGVLVGCLTATAASASATTVTVSPGGRVTGTAGAGRWVFNTARKTINCTQLAFTATLATSVTGTLPLTIATNLAFVCRGTAAVTGGAGVIVNCTAGNLNVTSGAIGGILNMSVTGIGCTFTVVGTMCSARLTGGLLGSWSNPLSQLTINTAGQTLAATGSSDGRGGTCPFLANDTSVSSTDATGAALRFAVTPTTTISVF
jgi:hypothetical protein